ncbi:hypothetical protein DICPUDRAFT_89640 [Dictyostelium purpureum]|uniref:Clu domain-containing protein n=1 Tax=Dictyostelium purpureum TaxID=5786 RepID=F0ZX69_DICPU|nr:uncharacterized protein DICPUDRAFT_89640 [Dictyostelium purpureum]EGC31469.1 hypothetical protein DICPUDRAFT_89640 [Dictyostelium purpureum]|eukprot:XP_003292008.1 hypothetical protein DICPUDRAFT_89640 [Dictyostelium purpureum]
MSSYITPSSSAYIDENNTNNNNNSDASIYIDDTTSTTSTNNYQYKKTIVNNNSGNIKISNSSFNSNTTNSNIGSNIYNNEDIWYYLKKESYSCISHIAEFQSYHLNQENKSVCSYIIDPSTTCSSSYSKIYSVTSENNGNAFNVYTSNSNSSYSINGASIYGNAKNSIYNTNSVSYGQPTTAYVMKESLWKNDGSSASSSYSSNYIQPLSVSNDQSLNSIINMTNSSSYGGYPNLNNSANNNKLQDSGSSNGSSNYIEQYLDPINTKSNNLMDSSYHYIFHNHQNSSSSSSSPPTLLNSAGSTHLNSSANLINSTSSTSSGLLNSTNSTASLNHLQQQQPQEDVLPWNESFQQILDKPIKSSEEELERNLNISNMSQLLANQAIKYVKTLVREVHLSPEDKTIKPYQIGGFAGGEKYKIDSMFIKFALNPFKIYEGNNTLSYFANKSAGHELKSISVLLSCGLNLHVPLICLLNYRGFRLSVISELPITSNTIVFGSSNAGATIHDNETVSKMMVKIGEILNLKAHDAKENQKSPPLISSNNSESKKPPKQVKIPLAIDIEGHYGTDGRYYIVDSARLLPPEKPQIGITGGFLYKLFREEFVKKYETQLCSDSFSNFQVVDLEFYNREIEKATNYLITKIIPNFVDTVLLKENTVLKRLNLKELLHSNGINLRYYGLVLYQLVAAGNSLKIVLNRIEVLKGKVIVEMLSRLLRFVVFSEMRKLNEQEDREHLQIVLNHLNLILPVVPSVNSHLYWVNFIANALSAKFTSSFPDMPQASLVRSLITESYGLFTLFNTQLKLRYKFLKKFSQLTGIVVSPHYLGVLKQISNNTGFNVAIPILQLSDFIEITVIVKHMKILSTFKAFEQFSDAEKYYLTELKYKIDKLGEEHTQVAQVHVNLSDLYTSNSYLKEAQGHLIQAVDIYIKRFGSEDLGTVTTKEKLGLVLIKRNKIDKAAEIFKEVLEVKKKILSTDNIEIADTYDNLAWVYQNKNDFQQSIANYSEALRIKNEKTGNSLTTAKTLNNIGHLFITTHEVRKAIEIFLKVREIFIAHRGPDHSDVAIAEDNLGIVYAKNRDYVLSEKSLCNAIQIRTKKLGKNSALVATSQNHLAQLYLSWDSNKNKQSESVPLFKSSIKIVDQLPDRYSRAFMRYSFSKYYRIKKDKNEELKLINESLQILEIHNIDSELIHTLRERKDNLTKSGISKLFGWINGPAKVSNSSVPIVNHNAIESQNQNSGHMEMTSNTFASGGSGNIPKEWQALFDEIGITNEEMSDPQYTADLQSIIQEALMEKSKENKRTKGKRKVLKKKDVMDTVNNFKNEVRKIHETVSTTNSIIHSNIKKSLEKDSRVMKKETDSECSIKKPALSKKIAPVKVTPPVIVKTVAPPNIYRKEKSQPPAINLFSSLPSRPAPPIPSSSDIPLGAINKPYAAPLRSSSAPPPGGAAPTASPKPVSVAPPVPPKTVAPPIPPKPPQASPPPPPPAIPTTPLPPPPTIPITPLPPLPVESMVFLDTAPITPLPPLPVHEIVQPTDMEVQSSLFKKQELKKPSPFSWFKTKSPRTSISPSSSSFVSRESSLSAPQPTFSASSQSTSLYPKFDLDNEPRLSLLSYTPPAPLTSSAPPVPLTSSAPPAPLTSSAPPVSSASQQTRLRKVVNISHTGNIYHTPMEYTAPTSNTSKMYPNLQSQQLQQIEKLQEINIYDAHGMSRDLKNLINDDIVTFNDDDDEKEMGEAIGGLKINEDESSDQEEEEIHYEDDGEDEGEDYEEEEEEDDDDEEESNKQFYWPHLTNLLNKEDIVNTIKQKLKEKRENLNLLKNLK